MKVRLVVLALLLLGDIILAPLLLRLPLHIQARGFKPGLEAWKQEALARPLAGPLILVRDGKQRAPWLWLQPAVGAAALAVLMPGYGRRRRKKADELGGPEAGGQGQHGTARWRSRKEINATFSVWRPPEALDAGGFVVGAEAGRRFIAWLDTQDTHCLLIGATRSGKSRQVIIPTIWALAQAGESMVIADPKGELYYLSAGYLRRRGYRVILLDFRDPGRSNRWNPLDPVVEALQARNEVAASQAAWDLANIITNQQPHYGDMIWPQSQESLTAALVLAVAMEAPPEARHMASAYALLTTLGAGGGEVLDEYFDSLPENHPARTAYGVAALSEDRLRSSIFTGTAAQLRLWADPEVAWLTARQDHDLAAAAAEKTAVFMVIPDERGTRHVLATLYIAQTYQALINAAKKHGGRLPFRVNFLLDEFGNLPAIPDFDRKLTVAAGRGMRFLLAVQDLAQIKARYKDAAQTITGNCATWIYLATADVETAKVISAKTGQYTVWAESYSSQFRGTSYSRGSSEALTGRPLLLPDEVLRWPSGLALILQARCNPAKLPLLDFALWPIIVDPVENEDEIREVIAAPPIWLPGQKAESGPKKPADDILINAM
ncbi:MAG: type secretion system protein VirD4 [Clostridia bacterium]|nr:type secretion system protein VirD4 [Clostridia bacterium]